MTIRHGTDDDLDAVRRLRERWNAESAAPPAWADVSWEANRPEVERALDANALFVAEEDGQPLGFVTAWLEDHIARIGDLYVAEEGRRHGAGRALIDAVIENLRARGATHLFVNANVDAMSFYERLGFREESRNSSFPSTSAPSARARPSDRSTSRPTIWAASSGPWPSSCPACPALAGQHRHAATQRLDHGLRRRLRPRTGDAAKARQGAVRAVRGGRDRDRRRARRGRPVRPARGRRVVDEYLSVPEHYGALPPGDAIALAANPRVVARLTGADPAAVRAAARTAASPDQLPPPRELLASIAATIGLQGAEHGWEET